MAGFQLNPPAGFLKSVALVGGLICSRGFLLQRDFGNRSSRMKMVVGIGAAEKTVMVTESLTPEDTEDAL